MATNEEILKDFCDAHVEFCFGCVFNSRDCCPFEDETLEAALYNLMSMVRDDERFSSVKTLNNEDFNLEEELSKE